MPSRFVSRRLLASLLLSLGAALAPMLEIGRASC